MMLQQSLECLRDDRQVAETGQVSERRSSSRDWMNAQFEVRSFEELVNSDIG